MRRTASYLPPSRSCSRSSWRTDSSNPTRTPKGALPDPQSCRTASPQRTDPDPATARSPTRPHQLPDSATGRETHLHLLSHVHRLRHAHPPIRDPNQLVYHRLIRPLRQQRRNGVVPPIQDEQQRRRRRLPKIPQLLLVVHRVQQFLSELVRHR